MKQEPQVFTNKSTGEKFAATQSNFLGNAAQFKNPTKRVGPLRRTETIGTKDRKNRKWSVLLAKFSREQLRMGFQNRVRYDRVPDWRQVIIEPKIHRANIVLRQGWR